MAFRKLERGTQMILNECWCQCGCFAGQWSVPGEETHTPGYFLAAFSLSEWQPAMAPDKCH